MAFSISKEAQQLLCEIINQISLTEKKAEQLRILVCRKTTFNPYSCFKKLDQNNKNQIYHHQLVQLLKEHEFFVQDCLLFMKQWFQKEFLTYQDFLQLILPKTDCELREITAMKQPTRSPPEKSTEYVIAQLINLEQTEALNLERLKARLSQLYHPDKMFESVDSLNNNVLSFKDFDRFFRRNGLLIYEDELFGFFFRIDHQRTGNINLADFRKLLICEIKEYNEPVQSQSRKFSNPHIPPIHLQEEVSSQAGQIIQLRCNTSNNNSQQKRMHPVNRSSSNVNSLMSTKNSSIYNNDDQRFIDLGLEILKVEMYLEEIRLKLQQQKEFNPMDFFHFMDQKNQGKVNQQQFSSFLQIIQLQNIDSISLFQYLDKDSDGYVRYSDISEFITPTNLNSSFFSSKPAKNSQLKYSFQQLFTKTTVGLILQLFNKWDENQEKIKKHKNQIISSLKLTNLYEKIDTFKKETINRQDLQRYFERHEIVDDIKPLFRQIAKQKKEITFEEFQNFFYILIYHNQHQQNLSIEQYICLGTTFPSVILHL